MDIKKDDVPVIYKQDILDKNGKLTLIGAFLVLSAFVVSINVACKYLQEHIVDKDNIN